MMTKLIVLSLEGTAINPGQDGRE